MRPTDVVISSATGAVMDRMLAPDTASDPRHRIVRANSSYSLCSSLSGYAFAGGLAAGVLAWAIWRHT